MEVFHEYQATRVTSFSLQTVRRHCIIRAGARIWLLKRAVIVPIARQGELVEDIPPRTGSLQRQIEDDEQSQKGATSEDFPSCTGSRTTMGQPVSRDSSLAQHIRTSMRSFQRGLLLRMIGP